VLDLDLECCGCGGHGNVRNIVLHSLRAPVPGTGWGCVQCHLPLDGAVSVICDACAAAGVLVNALTVCYGKMADNKHVPFDTLSLEPFDHDMRFHAEDTQVMSSWMN
jgi:hypothetical protein